MWTCCRAVAVAVGCLLFIACGGRPADTGTTAAAVVGACGGHLPDPAETPGKLCTPTDPNFSGYRYAEQIPYCIRNVPTAEKVSIAAFYGVPQADFSNYEFDHYIPLSAGGSDDPSNVWPQVLFEAHQKDLVEQQVYNGLSKGTMTQAQSVAMIRAWRPAGVSCPQTSSNVQAASAAVTFQVDQVPLAPGQSAYLVGDSAELGSWNSALALPLTSSGPGSWATTVDLAQGEPVTFKFIVVDGAGNALWENGALRQLVVPSAPTASFEDGWQL